jgi:hypothetical protein
MPSHKRSDVEAAGRRTDQGEVEQLDSAGKGLPVPEDDYVSKREGVAGQDVNRLTRPV